MRHLLTRDGNSPYLLMAFGLRIANGFSLGIYILIYVAAVGYIGDKHIQPIGYEIIGLIYVISIYIICYFLEVWAGAVGDAFGTRVAMTFSYFMKALFFGGLLLMVIYPDSVYAFWMGGLISIIAMSLHYTLFSGNFEAFLLSLTPNPLKAKKVFGNTLAWKYAAIIVGATIALFFLTGYNKNKGAQISEYADIPFALGFIICLVFSFLSWFNLPKRQEEDHIKPEIGSQTRINSIKEQAYKRLNSGGIFSNLKNLYYANATIYGLLQCLSVIIPLWVIFSDENYSFIEMVGILAFAQYFPAILGSLLSNFFKKNNEKELTLDYASSVREIRNLTMLFCLIIIAFAVSGILQPQLIILLIILVGSARGIHAAIQPKLEHVVTDFAEKNSPGEKRALISINRKWEKIGGVVGIGLAIAVQLGVFSAKNNLLLYSLILAAILAAGITLLVLQPKAWIFQQKVNLSISKT